MKFGSRKTILVLLDMVLICLSILIAYLLRFDLHIPHAYLNQFIAYAAVSMIVGSASLIYFKMYKRVWEYASIGEVITIIKAVLVTCTVSYLIMLLLHEPRVPFSVYVRVLENMILIIGASRFLWRVLRDKYYKKKTNKKNALIIGAGDCGIIIAKELKFNPSAPVYPVAFIDDDPFKYKHLVMGIPVLGGRNEIIRIAELYEIEEIIIAMPSVSKVEVSEIIDICKHTKAKMKIIPRINDLIEGKVSINAIRDVQVEDLLGRDPINVDLDGIANYVQDKVVLVTGAGGSIGSELCRQIAHFQPSKLILLGHGENSIYVIEKEISRKFPALKIEPVIADVQDLERMKDVFRIFQPKVVFHAAAHKHVPLMERNPAEAIKNNVFGTRNVAECAHQYKAERFVLVSTDKAVNPTSVMGATKRIAELIIQSLDRVSQTKFVAVRFGNVLGSRGSVIPHFKEQIALGGPVTVTHPEMVRYFMTIPEAVQLVIQAGAFAKGGEVFILDMGDPVKIVDLATDLIRLSGFEPGVDIEINFTGMRPGEKLYEELLLSEEGIGNTTHDRIFVGSPSKISHSELAKEIVRLEKIVCEEQGTVREAVKHLVPNFSNVG
ncbi:polysaccharide biosynthesis protein [Paenibacillus aceris]|uniref:FlaA1/EpsC-like NDP-sugar epimerase n=1 Tax=Paenibacillus aceris TaxID=869555 RepID=A0ABS4HVQ9_9BACL|nr:nucleoside-diphosphate sugar epimerase/dehydratase [Paenibacillus aceris]MBP1962316.1 FlaA1/EpsC-like NDP-sugar epimerase [Paenibacillus aceris]NHW37139.1 polysaccharide biosynthesis protein [Paenibacillus aceris]